MIYVKTVRNQYLNYAEYNVGNNNIIQTKFDFKFPPNLPNDLIPQLTTVTLYDSVYANLQVIDLGTVDISLTDINVNKPNETVYHLFFQTNFIINNPNVTREDLEKILKTCESIYTVSGGQDGSKEYTLFDSVAISDGKTELYMFKQIELKK